MKLRAPTTQKSSAHQNAQDSDSETENISVARTSTPVKTNTTTSKTTPLNSRCNYVCNSFLKTLSLFPTVQFLRYKVSTAQSGNQSPSLEVSTQYCRFYILL